MMEKWRAAAYRILKFSDRFPSVANWNSYYGTRIKKGRWFSSVATTVQRNPSFSSINPDDISYFKTILGDRGVVQDELALDSANTDWMHKYKGSSKLMLQPKTTEEVDNFFLFLFLFCHYHHFF